MTRRIIFSRLSLAAMLAVTTPFAHAQDIHFSQFDMAPMIINPAFTGMFDGQVRASGIYRTQWASVTIPYVTFGGAVDLPLLVERNGDYLAAGLQLTKDQAGDGNLSNFSGMASIAYHKFFGSSVGNTDHAGSDLAIGLQGGYAQQSIDLSKLYFGDEFNNGTFVQGLSNEYKNGLHNSVNYYMVNAGVSFTQAASTSFSYVLGAAAYNLNQPNNDLEQKQNSQSGLDMRFTGQIGATWLTGERLSLKPGFLFQSQASATEIIVGNEFHYQLGGETGYENFSTAVFLGGWYRSGDAALLTCGLEFKGFRVGFSYDYNISSLNMSSNGNGGFEIAVRYIAPNPMKFANKRTIPCSRF